MLIMSTKSIETSFILVVCLFIASSALAQSDNTPVHDKKGNPLERGKKYYIKPAITDSGGRFTLISRNTSCPLYVGQENNDLGKGLPVIFTPFAKEDKVVMVNRDFKVAFSAASICVQSTEWKLGEKDFKSGRRVITTGSGNTTASYFRIEKGQVDGIYNIRWCPSDVCPFCKFNCGYVGGLREGGLRDENAKIFLALDGSVLPLVFVKA